MEDAKALLDAVSNVSSSAFRADLKRLLTSVRSSVGEATVAAFAVRAVPRGENLFFTDRSSIPVGTGSELLVENILEKTKAATQFLVEPSVEDMRKRRVDVILFVTDNLGSGVEAFRFMSYFKANRSIRSWLSSGHVRFELAAHTVSDTSWAWINSDRMRLGVHLERAGSDFESAGWSIEQRARIIDLCERYADGPVGRLGYGDVTNLSIFDHTVGNGLPRILLQRKGPGGQDWVPLLPYDRAFGFDEEASVEIADHMPTRTPDMVIESLAAAKTPRVLQVQEKVALAASGDTALRPVLLYLVCLRLGIHGDFQIMRHSKMTKGRLLETREYSRALGLTTAQDHLTDSGRNLIKKFGSKSVRLVSAVHRESTRPYYPSQLR